MQKYFYSFCNILINILQILFSYFSNSNLTNLCNLHLKKGANYIFISFFNHLYIYSERLIYYYIVQYNNDIYITHKIQNISKYM